MNNVRKIKNIFTESSRRNNLFDKIGLNFFHTGILLLAAAPSISFVLILFSSFFGAINRKDRYFSDKRNWVLITTSLLMIFNCLLLTINQTKFTQINLSLIWIGLLNWLPFFWCFWSLQKYLNSKRLRLVCAKFFIIGSIPVLISGFCQYFLKLYGPYRFFNNLIIWYQRPLGDDGAVSGLFNNQNYAGAWLSIIFPICLFFLFYKNENKILKLFNFTMVFSFVAMTVLTTSRSAILAILISFFLLEKYSRFKIYLFFISIISILGFNKLMEVSNIDFYQSLFKFLPDGIPQKIQSFDLSQLDSLPRIEIWNKSILFINQNLFSGYGAGSFPTVYSQFNGSYEGIQHTHNIFLELAFNHGILVSLLILITMVSSILLASKKYFLEKKYQTLFNVDKAWIISFLNFLLIHLFDITYFDGRISLLCWTLLAGLTSISKEEES